MSSTSLRGRTSVLTAEMESELYCQVCKRHFFSAYNLRRHMSIHEKRGKKTEKEETDFPPSSCFPCVHCNRTFGRKDNLQRHIERSHADGATLTFRCGLCSQNFPTFIEMYRHRKREHQRHHDFREIESAHCRQTRVLRRHFSDSTTTLDEALIRGFSHMRDLIDSLLVEHKYFKVNFTMFVEMYRIDEEGQVSEMEIFPFRGLGFKVHREKNVRGELIRVCGDIERNVDEFLFQGSGWIINKPMFIEAEVVQCRPLAGGLGFCNLHLTTDDRRGRKMSQLVFVKDGSGVRDGGCFFLAIAAHFLMGEKPIEEKELREFVRNELVVPKGCEKYVDVKSADIDRVEELNAGLGLQISVVYEDESGAFLPARAAKRPQSANHIVLRLFHVEVEDKKEGKNYSGMHYALVQDPDLLFAARTYSRDGKVIRTNKVKVCWNCHNTLTTEAAYENHIAFCHQNSCQKVLLPAEGETLSFEGGHKVYAKEFCSAYMLFFDFEALQVEKKIIYDFRIYHLCTHFIFPPSFFRSRRRKAALVQRKSSRLLKIGTG